MFRKESKITFRGTVYSKHKAKGTILEIETNDNEMITVDNPSCELDRFVLVYDSIVKLNEQNICIVKRDSTQKTMHYLYDGVRGGVTDCY